jgi:hypothetical protein
VVASEVQTISISFSACAMLHTRAEFKSLKSELSRVTGKEKLSGTFRIGLTTSQEDDHVARVDDHQQ